ncbi:biofilm protein TabA [Formivibrio citricus]|uniref:Biofilm protein TabA n=1 Tax=Formivibrio citricus TaxID=83765 RepID=A0A1I4XFZ8_9NEIS|nr:YhcH/YjgK/YiaL family protein [Formivibrio citricus]SFN24827.1 biofilm protein TabA [Formivibrio citricus]
MITGLLADSARHKALLPAAIVRGLGALEGRDLAGLPAGRYEIEGEKLFFLVQDAVLRPAEECRPEAHRSHADIQLPVSGRERYGAALPVAGMQPVEDLLDSKDVAFYAAPENEFFLDLDPGSFVVFFPGELHRPCVAVQESTSIRKVVVKVHASLLGLQAEQ